MHGLVKAMQAVSRTWLVSFLLGVLHFLVSAGSLFYSLSVSQTLTLQGPASAPPPGSLPPMLLHCSEDPWTQSVE